MEHALEVLSQSWLGVLMRGTPALFPTMEILHFVGLSLLMGVMILVDLRILGAFRAIPYAIAFKFLPIAVLGLALSLTSGIAFIATNPHLYSTNIAFYWKMGLVALAGVNALWFTLTESRKVSALAPDQSASIGARLMAGGSLALWTGVIVLGRLLPTFAGVGGG